MVRVKLNGSAGVLCALVGLGCGCDGVGLGSASPVSSIVGFEFDDRRVVCESFVAVTAVHIGGTLGLVHAGYPGWILIASS